MQVSIHGTFGPFSNPTGRAVSSVVITYTAATAANSAQQTIPVAAFPVDPQNDLAIVQDLQPDTYTITGQTFDDQTPPQPIGAPVQYAGNPLVVTTPSAVTILVALK